MKFTDFDLSASTLKALEKKGFEEPSPIQEQCIPRLLASEQDLIGQAQTGTGKTAAFGIPIVEKVDGRKKFVQSMILAPTRELAIQVAEELHSLKGEKKINIALLYGGAAMRPQMESLKRGAHIVVGTPGRTIDMIKRGLLKLDQLKYFILDEADEMLNMGFLDDIEEILKSCNDEKQMLFFSATMPQDILRVAKTYMNDYEIIKVAAQQLTTKNTEQIYFEVRERDKFEALCRIIDSEPEFYAIIFSRTKRECDQLAQKLQSRGYATDAMHGDIEQRQRERILKKFKARKTTILVATDVAARGIDVDDLTHVINYHIPQNPESYTHRIGRTGRAGKEGTAITLITPREWKSLNFIQRVTKTDIQKGELPSIDNVVEAKKDNVKEKIATMSKANFEKYKELTEELLKEHDAETLVNSLLKIAFADQLEADNYREIEHVERTNFQQTGTARLFVARGRKHDMGPRELAEFIQEETGIDQSKLNDIRVLEEFSFVTCNFADAEFIINMFKRKPGRSIVSKARDKNDRGDSRSSGSRGSYRGNNSRNRSSSRNNSRGGSRGGRGSRPF